MSKKDWVALCVIFSILLALMIAGPFAIMEPAASAEVFSSTVTSSSSATTTSCPKTTELTTLEPSTTAPPLLHAITYKGNTFTEGQIIPGSLTNYCACAKCCGKWASVVPRCTADGTLLDGITENIASCNWLPFNAVVEIEGEPYRIADRGGSGLSRVGRLDIYFPEGHAAALAHNWPKDIEIRIISLPA